MMSKINSIMGHDLGWLPRRNLGVPKEIGQLGRNSSLRCAPPHGQEFTTLSLLRTRPMSQYRYKSDPFRSSPRARPWLRARWTLLTKASVEEPQQVRTSIANAPRDVEAHSPRHLAEVATTEVSVEGNVPTSPADPQGCVPPSGRGPSAPPYNEIRALDAEILSIGLPMLATLAADPIAGLVDSAYMGRAGSAQLAAVGVALSIFNTATKLFNVPLLAVTTSAVAKATGEARRAVEAAAAAAIGAGGTAANNTASTAAAALSAAACVKAGAAAAAAVPHLDADSAVADTGRPVVATAAVGDDDSGTGNGAGGTAAAAAGAAAEAAGAAAVAAVSAQARAASACIWLAVLVGLLQAVLLVGAGPRLVAMWGVTATSPVAQPALGFLLVRAVGAPVTILMLTLQGVFRGLQDTRTPLQATLVSNAINIALAPMLIFGAGLGAVGAAVATVAAQAIPLVLMARELRRKLVLHTPQAQGHGQVQQVQQQKQPRQPAQGWSWSQVTDVLPLFKPTGFLVLRSVSVSATYAFATTLVARAGAAVTASHQICFQLWLACSLLADALAVAAQSLMARDLGSGSVSGARMVAGRVGSLSVGLGLLLAGGLAACGAQLPGVFSSDPEVLRLVGALFPVIAATQPITVLAMAWDGILYGAGGFRYAAVSMALAALPAIALMQFGGGAVHWIAGPLGVGASEPMAAAPGGAPQLASEEQLWLVWAGLAVLMLLRWLTIAVPYAARIGPFRQLRGEGL
ncbi:hypothetical protein VOLCADRAFT_88992 [Volvox carteri f. nagariensis]|uniref:Protein DETOXIFICATION n=1 Tax=Volvox carteri f. nagariensis TaxID=3068 RepID=D8TQI0_VOLCA|nr:uncharacterized protein VOLCADRAFT_88992 [Volvox carteri f. nagariensis]EFJ50158.1 hypothetical protein VOLCADRAFT_88992 [Volvox carteri f. nagariensis]|eukprot:XP_002948778.1 hypothetical protein VOLCADRAFT_88992 [Volvox carteri f. nagariensis]